MESLIQLASDFNNYGVDILSETGSYAASLDLFRLTVDIMMRNAAVSVERLFPSASVSEYPHLLRTLAQASEAPMQSPFMNMSNRRAATSSSSVDENQSEPHVYRSPMRIPRQTEQGSQTGCHLVAAIALFNAAVTHQSLQSNHVEIPLLYHASSGALSEVNDSAVSFDLVVATLYNFAVLCLTTGDVDGACASFERERIS